jgi:hypothetical protein
MSDDLRTVATFTDATLAAIARNRLEAAGIAACVADDQTVSMDFLLGNAVGWVKVQVRAADAARAAAVLAERETAPETPSAEAGPAAEDDAPDEPDVPESDGDRRVRYALRASVLGLVLCPPLLHLYSFAVLLGVLFRNDPLSPAANRRFYAAFLIDAIVLTVAAVLVVAR